MANDQSDTDDRDEALKKAFQELKEGDLGTVHGGVRSGSTPAAITGTSGNRPHGVTGTSGSRQQGFGPDTERHWRR